MPPEQPNANQREFRCIHCHGKILVPRDLPPTTGPCPHCEKEITSPGPSPDPEPEVDPIFGKPVQEDAAGATTPPPPSPSVAEIARRAEEKAAAEEAERKAAEEAERKAAEEAKRKAAEEAERKAAEEAQRKAAEEAERKAAEEAERKVTEEAPRKAAQEAERKAAEEAELEAAEEARRKAVEEVERQAVEEAERSAAEDARRQAEEERRRRELAERQAEAANRQQAGSVAPMPPMEVADPAPPPAEPEREGVSSPRSEPAAAPAPSVENPLKPTKEATAPGKGKSPGNRRKGRFPVAAVVVLLVLLAAVARSSNFSAEPLKVDVLFRRTPEGLRIDWETFVQTKHRTLRDFLELPVAGHSEVFRVILSETMPEKRAVPAGHRTYLVSDPAYRREDSTRVNVPVDSEVGRALSILNWRGARDRRAISKTATIELRWAREEIPQLEISRFLCWEFLGVWGEAVEGSE